MSAYKENVFLWLSMQGLSQWNCYNLDLLYRPLVWKYTAALADHNGLFMIKNSISCKFEILLLLNRAKLLSIAMDKQIGYHSFVLIVFLLHLFKTHIFAFGYNKTYPYDSTAYTFLHRSFDKFGKPFHDSNYVILCRFYVLQYLCIYWPNVSYIKATYLPYL